MLTAHRKVPNRALELKERMWARVEARLGSRVICTRCRASYRSMNEMCVADLDDRCPGFCEVDNARSAAAREVGLT